MNDLDLEDLESRLYSQIYHVSVEETEKRISNDPVGSTDLSKPTNDMRRPGGRYFGPWSPAAKFQSKNQTPRQNNSRNYVRKNNNSGSKYSKDYEISQKSAPQRIVHPSSKEKKKQWKEKQMEKKKQKRNKRLQKNVELKEPEVISLSDSDENDDSCVLIDNNWPVLSVVDSDDENKASAQENTKLGESTIDIKCENSLNESVSDDVIFVEPPVVPIEVINIDEESESDPKKTNVTSAPHSDNIKASSLLKQIHSERKELLRTPDSASNDFMGNSGVELNQTNFNFSLHGSDFNSGEFLKPAPRNETCETESSSSTTDVNLMKSAVFNEIDFPKDDIFSENNLESFGNFITPLRNNPTVEVVQSSPVRASSVQNTNEYSDASSESDFEESQKDVGQKTKQLPELSPMLSTNEISNVQLPKRSRKMPNMNSKYDLINSDVTSPQTKKSLKKKKKIKKKKNDEESGNITEIEERGIDDELKRKKRKSGQIESEEKCENHSKKKTLFASKEDKNSSESQSNVELQDVKVETETESSEIISKEETNTEAAKKSSFNINSQSVAIQESKDVTEKEELNNEVENKKEETAENSALEGFLIVDEVINNDSEVIFSDSDSALSPLQQPSDIQLNCEDGKTNMSETEIHQDNFSVKDLQMAMSNDPDLWEILECDKTPSGRNKGRRCNRCRQFGHMAIRCPNKVEPKCALCGESGHYEPRCPNKICTQCGQRSPYSTTYCSSCFKFRNYQCPICSMMGHLPKTCPDLWRRYHLTTEEGPLVIYNGPTLKNKNQLWCSGCAQPGHLEHSCRFYRSVYPPQDPHIKSYEDVYHKKTSPNLNSRQQQFKPLIQAPPNYGTVLNSQIIQTVDQPDLQIFNYNQNNYGNINPPFVNPYLEGIFVANQQNFFPSLATNVLQYPQNNYHNQFEIPNFVSFDDTPRNNYEVQKTAPSVKETNAAPGKIMRRKSKVFFSGSANQLQHFIFEELHRLSKLSLVSNKLLKELRKGQAPRRRDLCQREEYYETLNMLLFGVFNLIDGKTHLERLKQFKRDRVRMRVDNATRRILHNSYCYIFGRDKHHGVNYNELLRTV